MQRLQRECVTFRSNVWDTCTKACKIQEAVSAIVELYLETEEKMRTYMSSSSSSIIICIWNSEKLHIPGHFPLVIAMNLQFDILFPSEVFRYCDLGHIYLNLFGSEGLTTHYSKNKRY